MSSSSPPPPAASDDKNNGDGDDKKEEPKQQKKQPAAAAEAGLGLHQMLDGKAIHKLMKSSGPVVKAVLLRHMRKDGKDGKPHVLPHEHHHEPQQHAGEGNDSKKDDSDGKKPHEHHHHAHPHHAGKRVVLSELIEEIDLDTTPSKNQVKEVLGGPFSFLGQYATEGTVVMVRRELPCPDDELSELTVPQLRELCADHDVDTSTVLEKSDLVDALLGAQLPVNPHRLQPPFDGAVIRGDVLILRVAETDEALDDDDGDGAGDGAGGDDDNKKKEVQVLTNDEFFLDYTKDEYVAFASRTDVVAPELPSEEESEEEESDEDDDDDDGDYHLGEDDDEETEEEEKMAMLNIVMNEVLRKFRADNGRGPGTDELLELRKSIADQLGVQVATLEALKREDDDGKPPAEGKRKAADDDQPQSPHSCKKVKFSSLADASPEEEEGDEGEGTAAAAAADGDSKVAAVPSVPTDDDNEEKND